MTHDQNDRPAATDGGTDEAAETPIETDVIESVAADENVPQEDLVDALVVLNAALLGEHSRYEDEYDYVSVEGVRGYVVDTDVWERLRDEHDFEGQLAVAVQRAHAEQTEQLLAAADEPRANIDAGVVIGVDTAEVMN
jgi:ABC-type thiamine transport system substrate-binding protein